MDLSSVEIPGPLCLQTIEYRGIVLRYVEALESCLFSVKNKIEKEVQERYLKFQKSEQSHGNEEQHVNDVCKCA